MTSLNVTHRKQQLISSSTSKCSELLGTKGRWTIYSKDHFNGPKYLEQLSLHSCKREKNEKIWQNSSHLEFHSIFNQDGITNSPKKSAVSKGKKGKTSSPTEVFKNLFKCDWKHPEHLKAGLFLSSFTKKGEKNRRKIERQIETKRNNKETAGFFFSPEKERRHWWHHQTTTRTAFCHMLPPVWSYLLT